MQFYNWPLAKLVQRVRCDARNISFSGFKWLIVL